MTSEKFVWADNLRTVATVAVILVHVCAGMLYQYNSISHDAWWTGNICISLVRFCVPAFLMLTGAFLLPRIHELKSYFQKRVTRVVYPFLFWSFIYIGFNLIGRWQNGNLTSASETLRWIYWNLKNGASLHLWYIYMVIGIYLVIPIISKWIVHSIKNEILYYIVLWFITVVVSLPWLAPFMPTVDLQYFIGYLGYPILGYYLTLFPKTRQANYVAIALFICGVVITTIGTYYNFSGTKENYTNTAYKYLSPNVIMASVGVFVLFKNTQINSRLYKKFTEVISKYSYGIYLSHMLVLVLLEKAGISWSFIHPVVGIPLTTLVCLFFSWLITYLLNKIPYGSFIAG